MYLSIYLSIYLYLYLYLYIHIYRSDLYLGVTRVNIKARAGAATREPIPLRPKRRAAPVK